jgi:hypothetical protein
MRPRCAKLASGVLAFAASRAAAAAGAVGRLLRRAGAGNIVFAASLLAVALAACAWPWLVLEVAAWAAGILLFLFLLAAAADACAEAVVAVLFIAGAVAAIILL